MRQYQAYFQQMMEANKPLFDEFKKIHDAYVEEPDFWKAKYNEVGRDVLDIMRDYERRLCSQSEKGQYGKFSSNLSAKFWAEVKTVFPKIDFVGVM